MSANIHPTAIIEDGAKLGAGVEIGAYAYIGAEVRLGDRCRVHHHANITGKTTTGPENEFYPFVSIGGKTQDLKYKGEPTYLEIGSNNVFREFATVNRGTAPGEKTVVGSHNHFLAYIHIAHNCVVGSHVIFSNNATLAGHVTVGDYAILGGLCAVHQFCRIGDYAMVGGCTKIVQDVPTYCIADGNPATVRGVNVIGLQRNGFDEEEIKTLRRAYRILYDETLNTSQALAAIEKELPSSARVQALVDFVKGSSRGIIR